MLKQTCPDAECVGSVNPVIVANPASSGAGKMKVIIVNYILHFIGQGIRVMFGSRYSAPHIAGWRSYCLRLNLLTLKAGKEVITMARVVLAGILQDIRASIGASTFSAWKGVSYLRNKAITVANAQTTKQMEMRAQFGESIGEYRGLTTIQKAMWEEYAQQQKTQNAKNEVVGDFGIIPQLGKTQSGFNAYIGVNQVLYRASFPRVAMPPKQPQPKSTRFVVLTGTGATIHIEWTSVVNPLALTQNLEIWLKGWWKGAHPYMATIVPVPTPPVIPPPIDITTIRKGWDDKMEEVPFASIVPCEVFVQGIIVRSDGYRSVPTALQRVKVIA
ncbi:MAG: hypothetical protein HY769_02990 [Candidatus Stahlbacteria bacterium]|nr:hypothetical protein [Candidatus Stahlbacteria bacterium]